jgi:hypothetical protein
MRTHPYLRTAFIGLAVGVLVGAAFYLVLRAFGTHASRYLLVAVVLAFIPGAVMLSELIESDELEKEEWPAEEQQPGGDPRNPPDA